MAKSLKDMTLEALWQLFPIVLKEYNVNYPDWYLEEKQQLEAILGLDSIKRINHIGSTAIKGLIAKPIIDILLEVDDTISVKSLIEKLENAGWILMRKEDEPFNLVFNKGYTPQGFAEKVYHLHVRHLADWNELYFRDYLNAYQEVQREYENLKLELKKQFEHNRDAYTDAKAEFIRQQTEKARVKFGKRYH